MLNPVADLRGAGVRLLEGQKSQSCVQVTSTATRCEITLGSLDCREVVNADNGLGATIDGGFQNDFIAGIRKVEAASGSELQPAQLH